MANSAQKKQPKPQKRSEKLPRFCRKNKDAHYLKVRIPAIFKPLLSLHKRIKFCYGGRAGGKSYAFADSLLVLGRMKKIFVVCLREVQNSIKDSVHKLLSDRIAHYGLSDYRVTDLKIENKITGTQFVFKGLRDQDPQKIKSLEGADIAWIEEAQTITKKSWDILEPTIRKEGSEIWISMNREHENDALWTALANEGSDKIWLQKVNFYDNPFCPQEMKDLAKRCQEKSPDDYAHIWLGEPVRAGDDKLIEASLVRAAQERTPVQTTAPLVIGLDIARFGDDASVFCFRRGRVCEGFKVFRKKDTVELAHLAKRFIISKKPARLFLDIGGVGAGVYDVLLNEGFAHCVKGVGFGEKANLFERYANKRAEMWDGVRSWLKLPDGVSLPKEAEIMDDLCTVKKQYDKLGRLLLEEKAAVKRRLGRSPDWGDALALTFAASVPSEGEELFKLPETSVESLFLSVESKEKGW